MRKHDEETAVKALNRKQDCKVNMVQRTITLASAGHRVNDLGNKSWGKIDFLTRYKGYKILR